MYDVGENIAGWCRLKILAEPGTRVRLRFAEKRAPDGGLDTITTGVAATKVEQVDEYVASGKGDFETWEPCFTYHGFQYVELTVPEGKLRQPPGAETLTTVVVHTDLPAVGTFTCSDEQLNRLHTVAVRTVLANIHGLPTDCPARERCGWTGDAHAVSPVLIANWDTVTFLDKYVGDMVTGGAKAERTLAFGLGFHDRSQRDKPAGIPHMIAPGKRTSGMATPDWGSALVFVPWDAACASGDTAILAKYHDAMVTWTEFLLAERTPDGILATGLGDWCAPSHPRAPSNSEWIGTKEVPLTSTLMLIRCLDIMARTAVLLNRPDEAKRYAGLHDETVAAFWRVMQAEPGLAARSQTALGMAWQTGDGLKHAPAVWTRLRESVQGGNHFDTGIFGTKPLLEVLNAQGDGDAAVRLLTKPEMPSFRAVLDLGATSLWESWPTSYESYKASMSHPMQAGFDAWLYSDVAGLAGRQSPDGPYEFRWFSGTNLASASAVRRAPEGKVSSEWRREAGAMVWTVEVPPGATGRIGLPPVAGITESENPWDKAEGISAGGRMGAGAAERQIALLVSGRYVFRIPTGR
jgi:alpha-L-rhamnosidase